MTTNIIRNITDETFANLLAMAIGALDNPAVHIDDAVKGYIDMVLGDVPDSAAARSLILRAVQVGMIIADSDDGLPLNIALLLLASIIRMSETYVDLPEWGDS